MPYTISENEFFGLICLQYGLPTVLFLVLNAICLQHFHYRMWRLQIWLHRLTNRFRFSPLTGSIGGLPVDPHSGFDAQNHYHDLSQDYPLIRLGVAPLLAFGVVTLMVLPFVLLVAWGLMMYVALDEMLVGIAIFLMGVCITSLYYAIQYWYTGGWRITRHISFLFGFSLGTYFLLAFFISFLADGVSFFGQSVHFMALNYILLTELLCQAEKLKQLPAATLLAKADEDAALGSANDTTGVVALGAERLTREEREKRQKEAEKRFFEKFKSDQLLASATAGGGDGATSPASPDAPDSDEELPDDEEDERRAKAGRERQGATLIEIKSSTIETQFTDVLHTLIHETREQKANEEVRYQVKIYVVSIAVLLGYAFAIYKGNGPTAGADGTLNPDGSVTPSDGAQWLGFIVAGILLVWDALMYVYATHSGKVLDDQTKILVLGGSRVALISFGFQGWFLGVVCLYFAAGIYLTYRIIDRRLPYAAWQLTTEKQHVQRFREFAVSLENPDHAAAAASTSSSNALLQTMTRNSASGGMGIAEFVLLLLSVLFFMCLCISYQTSPPAQDLGTFTKAPWQQWEVGLVAWYCVLMFACFVVTVRAWLISEFRFAWKNLLFTVITEGVFSLGGYLIFDRTNSIILLVSLTCGPIFVLAVLGTYTHCVKVDWHLLQPEYLRNPPMVPFPLALLSCGLQRDDYRMLGNIVVTGGMMCVIGLAITLGLHGSAIGWSITFVLFILLTSLIPLVKYLQTLHLDKMDYILLFLWFSAHVTFFALLNYVQEDELTDNQQFALWGSAVGYPTVLANILCFHLFKQAGHRMTHFVAKVFLMTFILVVICIIVIFFTLGATTGGIVLAILVVAMVMGAIGIRWVGGNYTLPRYLRILTQLFLALLFFGGVALGVALPGEGSGFWAFSASWFLLIAMCGVIGYGDKARLAGGGGGGRHDGGMGGMFRYAEHVFPVYYYDRRNETNPVRPANAHMAYYCLAFGGMVVWCAACMVTARVNLGLGLSALTLLSLYTFLRNLTISSNKRLLSILPYITSPSIHKSREVAREMQVAGTSILFEDPQPNIFGLRRWGQIVYGMMHMNLDPRPQLKKKQAALKRKLALGRACFCTRLETDPHELDEHFILLERLHEWSFAVSSIRFKLEAHFYFQLLLNAHSEVQAEEALMKAFCQWLRKEKIHPITGQPVHLDPAMSNHEMYDAPATKFGQAYLLQLQQWKLEYTQSLLAEAGENEANRAKEAEADRIREERLEAKERKREARKREKEEKAKKLAEDIAAGLVKDANGNTIVTSAVASVAAPISRASTSSTLSALPATDPEVQDFLNAIDEYARTGKKFVDEDFPATPESLYLDGERNPAKGSAVNLCPIDDEWRRPEEILKWLQQENPEQHIPQEPKLFIDGFDLSDIVQGAIGTCYFLSAIGCLGIRELANPRQPLLTDIFTLSSTSVAYNECGAFLVRFYREGKVKWVCIDDRLPVSQGNYAFSHAKQPNELWVSLLEKAYARVFGCYEAIEAGLISQALCDLSNGASEQIALKGANGQLCVDAEDLWIRVYDSFKSGYLIGAGSNTGSDTTTDQGIAQGHAYMVVKCFAFESTKLIQLQNPHGHGEWTGDWCDSSDKWTQWWKNTLQVGEEKDDGKFWMSFEDFLQSYQNIYICRLLPVRKSLSSQWKGHTACGPVQPYHNPTFLVSTPQPCKVWIELEQTNKRGKKPKGSGGAATEVELAEQQAAASSSSEYAFIQFFVLDNGGKRVEKIVKEAVKGCANKFRMLNDRQISAEVFLDAPDTPFTIVCTTSKPGVETGLTLSIFCADEAIQFRQLPEEAPTA